MTEVGHDGVRVGFRKVYVMVLSPTYVEIAGVRDDVDK